MLKDKSVYYFISLVTPGLGAAAQILRFNRRLIKDDFPTFGYPMIPALTCIIGSILKTNVQEIARRYKTSRQI